MLHFLTRWCTFPPKKGTAHHTTMAYLTTLERYSTSYNDGPSTSWFHLFSHPTIKLAARAKYVNFFPKEYFCKIWQQWLISGHQLLNDMGFWNKRTISQLQLEILRHQTSLLTFLPKYADAYATSDKRSKYAFAISPRPVLTWSCQIMFYVMYPEYWQFSGKS